jgi:hypoxanthine phosphoribosyltransferase
MLKMEETIRVHNKEFNIFIKSAEISEMVDRLAKDLTKDLKGKDVVFIGILNGAFIFAADLIRKINMDCYVSFVKTASYKGTQTSGHVETLIGLGQEVKNKTVVIIEDIVDTGLTLEAVLKEIKDYQPAEILVVALLFKCDACIKEVKIDYLGREIPNDFVIGYGLDYNGYGRNLRDIYKITSS